MEQFMLTCSHMNTTGLQPDSDEDSNNLRVIVPVCVVVVVLVVAVVIVAVVIAKVYKKNSSLSGFVMCV